MRVAGIFSALWAAALVAADARTAQIFIQPIDGAATNRAPQPLAEVAYDPAALDASRVLNYDAPEIPEAASLVRIGLYDPQLKQWLSGTTAASVDNFGKGYAPNLLLSVSDDGHILSVAFKGVRIDAGQTRDFGPHAVVLLQGRGKQPELNKPVVLSPDGKKVAEEEEKTLLQKFWWVGAIVLLLTLTGGGDK